MRHGKKINSLGRTSSHRKALMSNLASSLIEHKRINTTITKAKALRKYIEPLITKAKTDNTHNRRVVFSYLKQKEAVRELFSDVIDRIGERPGGYTRILRTGNRLGDNAEMCFIELVDFNEAMLKDSDTKSGRKRRRRRGGGAKKQESSAKQTETSQKDSQSAESGETKQQTPSENSKEETSGKAEKSDKKTPKSSDSDTSKKSTDQNNEQGDDKDKS